MKKSILIAVLSCTLFSCSKEKNEITTSPEFVDSLTNTKDNNSIVVQQTPFDWEKIYLSTAEIGSFPYLAAPEGFMVYTDGYGGKAENGMSKYFDFNKLIMYDGKGFFDAEGKKAVLLIGVENKNDVYNQYKLDKSIDDYFQSIGAVLLFKGQIPSDQLTEINKTGSNNVYDFIQGDPWNSDPVRHYALNHTKGKIVFQVWTNSASAEVGVVEIKDFKQTIKAPSASEMQKEIDASGKAVLNISFDTDKATLKPEGQKIVDEIYNLLSAKPSLKLSIEGHTDNTGSAEKNKKLSADRANTTMYALAAKGIDIKRLKATGFGVSKPIAPNDSEQNKAKNRRVEIVKF